MAEAPKMKMAEWFISGQPGLNSYESESTPLSWAYATGVDTRFPGVVQLAPLITALDFTAQHDNATNTRAIAFTEGITTDTAELGVFACGRRLVAVRLDTRIVTSTASAAAFSSAVTDLEVTKNKAGTQELSACLESNIYQVVTAFDVATTTYTASANNESVINRFISKGDSYEADGQVFGLGQTSSIENTIRHNVLTGTVAMDASAWATRATIGGPNITFTGFALDGPFAIVGTNYGPYKFNNDHQVFQPMLPELLGSPSTNNCKGMRAWSKLGVVIPLERETRLSSGLESKSIGVERFPTNLSPVYGRVTAQGYSEQWGIWNYYNPVADQSYLCWVRPRQPWEYHSNPVSIFPMLALDAGVECEAIEWAAKKGGTTNDTWYVGLDNDAGWMVEGRHFYGPSDTNCTYAASGTIYLSALTRSPGTDKQVKHITFETDGCSSTETITPTITWSDKFGQAQSVALPAINSDGFHIITITDEKMVNNESFALELAFARGGTTTNTPRIVRRRRQSDIQVWYTETPARDRNGRILPV